MRLSKKRLVSRTGLMPGVTYLGMSISMDFTGISRGFGWKTTRQNGMKYMDEHYEVVRLKHEGLTMKRVKFGT